MSSVAHIIRRRKTRRTRQKSRQAVRRTIITVISTIILLFLVIPTTGMALFGLVFYAQLTTDLPAPRDVVALDTTLGASQLYDRTGQTLLWSVEDPLGDTREWVMLDDLPAHLVQATLLIEDPDFLRTGYFDLFGTIQRIVYNYFDGPLGPDPTLTGRLVRNAIEPVPEAVTIDYRTSEYALVSEINRRYTPEEILEWHLNTNYYGNDAYGIDAAAQVYFNKRAVDLTLDEAAMLAAIPTAPQYNPVDDLVAARGRQSELLRDLLLNDVISQEEYNAASTVITAIPADAGQAPLIAPEYAIYARKQAESILSNIGYDGTRLVSRGGLKIISALDLDIYQQMECTLQAHLIRLNGDFPPNNPECIGTNYLPEANTVSGAAPNTGAMALIDVRSGELLAAYGDITAQTRQPGPVLYPFIYFEAFSSGLYTPATMLFDLPQRFPGAADGLIYTPTNPDGRFQGPINLRDAMGAGLLVPAAQVANAEGLDSILRTARLIGLSGLDSGPFDLSLLERGGGTAVLDVTYAYSVFAALGEMRGIPVDSPGRFSRPRNPVAVLRIEDPNGNVLWAYEDAERELSTTPILLPGLGYLVNHILEDASTRTDTLGAGNFLELSRPAAVIFGNAGDNNNWTIGYSPNMVMGVWVGRTDGAPFELDPYGSTGAGPVWRALMELTHDRYGLRADDWPRPQNIVEARVCERSGLRPNDACPERTEIFLENTQPPEADPYWQRVTINNQTGQLATANTPTAFREDRLFFVPPPEAAEWWEANQLPLPPQQYDTVTRPELVQSTVILRPELLDYVRGVVDIRGSMDAENLQYYQLAYGQGLNPSAWIDITGQQANYAPGQSLGTWDTSDLDGLYNLRLTAVLNDNSIDPYVIQVTVDNIPPTVSLSAGESEQIFTFLNDDVIPLQAAVSDNVRIDRVEFYHNGTFVGTDDTFPYGYNHPITRVGTETFKAVVFDAAGNQGEVELLVDILRGGT